MVGAEKAEGLHAKTGDPVHKENAELLRAHTKERVDQGYRRTMEGRYLKGRAERAGKEGERHRAAVGRLEGKGVTEGQ